MKKEQQKRATFEDVCNAQDKLLVFIDKCIQNNKPLDSSERLMFIRLFRHATLGLGMEYMFTIRGDNKTYNLDHVGHASYWLAYRTDGIVVIGADSFEIKRLWLRLRDYCFKIFPQAQQMSIKISKEQTRMGTSVAGLV